MKINSLVLFTALSIVGACGSFSHADFVTSHFQPPGSNTQLSDTSLENVTITGSNSSSVLQTGDILTGTVQYNAVTVQGGSTPNVPNSIQVTAYFQEVVTVGATYPGVGTVLTFAPTTAFQTTYGTGALAAFYENDSTTPYTSLLTSHTSGPLSTYVNAATSGTLLAVVGFTGTGGTATGGEGWSSIATTLSLSLSSAAANIASYKANLDLIANPDALLSSPNYIFSNTQGSTFNPSSPTQFQVSGTIFSQQSNAFNAGTFQLNDNSSVLFDVKVAPEPSSFVLLAFGGFGLIGAAWRRRRAVVA